LPDAPVPGFRGLVVGRGIRFLGSDAVSAAVRDGSPGARRQEKPRRLAFPGRRCPPRERFRLGAARRQKGRREGMSAPSPTRDLALTLPLRGSRLIEASAGTGKTFTISALFVRL